MLRDIERPISVYVGNDLSLANTTVEVLDRPGWIRANMVNFRYLLQPVEEFYRENVGRSRLGELCLGGQVAESDIRWAIASTDDLVVADGLVIERDERSRTRGIVQRAQAHHVESAAYIEMAIGFVRTLVAAAPLAKLPHARLEHLVGVKAGILAQEGMRERRD